MEITGKLGFQAKGIAKVQKETPKLVALPLGNHLNQGASRVTNNGSLIPGPIIIRKAANNLIQMGPKP